MKRISVLYICFLAVLIISSNAFAYDNRPIVVLREDDGRLTCRDVFPEFGNKSLLEFGKELRIPITWGVITNQTSNRTALTWNELIDYVANAGGELAAHSANHRSMNSLQDYITDLLLSKAAIENITTYPCNTFLQPGTWTNDAFIDTFKKLDNDLGRAIQDNFRQSQLYITGMNLGLQAFTHGTTTSVEIDYHKQPDIIDFLKGIDYVSEIPGYIYIIMFHGIQSSTNTLIYHVRADFMASLMTRLDQLRNDGKIRLLSINDAFNNQFSPDINRVYDSEFELYKPEIKKYVTTWQTHSGSSIVEQLGYNNTSCGRIIQGSNLRQNFPVSPGRYRLSWVQKPDNRTTLENGIIAFLYVASTKGVYFYPVTDSKYINSADDWEQKSIVLRVPEAGPIRLQFSSTGTFLIDNVSLKLEDTDPVNSVSDFKVIPLPTGMHLNWKAPDDVSYNKVAFKYSTKQKNPQTPDDGALIQQINADNGNNKTLFYPFNWNGKSDVYISAFAVKQDNTYSEPDVDYLVVDLVKPSVIINPVRQQKRVVDINWKSTASKSSIFANYYAIGSAPNLTDVVGWTEDEDCFVQLTKLQPGKRYYLSMKSQNVYGVWSDIVSSSFLTENIDNIASILDRPDGDTVVVTGIVSAIFRDHYYVQSENRLRGIKIIGPTNALTLGMSVTIEGTLATESGERYIQVIGPTP